MMKVQETDRYELFELLPFNRDVRKSVALRESMKLYGFLSAYPLFCLPPKGSRQLLRIKDGQHRFVVAKDLGLGVKYVTEASEITVRELAESTNAWNLRDFVVSGARAGDAYLEELHKAHLRSGIPLAVTALLLRGLSSHANVGAEIRRGGYKIDDSGRSFFRQVERLVEVGVEVGASYFRTKNFVLALARICCVEEFDPDELAGKIETHPELLQNQRTMAEAVECLEAVYNYHRKGGRLPLAFLANETAKERMNKAFLDNEAFLAQQAKRKK